MKMAALCENLFDLPAAVPADSNVTGIETDSRRVKPGSVFVAVPGYTYDGHNFIADAAARGASMIVARRPAAGYEAITAQVRDTRIAAALLAGRFRGNPSDAMRTIGVTGTNGKTTFTCLMESILARAGFRPGVIGTLTYRWPGHEEKAVRTTPDAVELQTVLERMRRDGADSVVMEVSSHALQLHRTEGIGFDAAVFTNLSRDHLDFHADMDAYLRAKARLFTCIRPDGYAVINADDPAGEYIRRQCTARTVSYGFGKSADWRIGKVSMDGSGSRFVLEHDQIRIEAETSLPGRFNIHNAAAALITGLEAGFSPDDVLAGIAQVRVIPGRMERVPGARGFDVIVDYAHTPQALENVLQTAREFTRGSLVVVFGCGGDRDRGKRPLMGKIASSLADRVIFTSDNPRTEDPGRIIAGILAGAVNKDIVTVDNDRRSAICTAIAGAGPGDTIIIAGKGHESEMTVGETVLEFDDRVVAGECLKKVTKTK